MSDFNTGTVRFDFKDVQRTGLNDEVTLTFDHFEMKSLNFRKVCNQFPADVTGVVAAPRGGWTVFIQPRHYRPKNVGVHINVPSNGVLPCEQFFFLNANRARPTFPTATVVFSKPEFGQLAQLLSNSNLFERTGTDLWQFLRTREPLLAAGLLNLHARAQHASLPNGRTVFSYLQNLVEIRQDRLFAVVPEELHREVIHSTTTPPDQRKFNPASGVLHPFFGDYTRLESDSSFKTPEDSGNLQVTFAKNPENQLLVDMDVDDAQGIKHAFDVLKHAFTGEETHPYDIHQILCWFYSLDPGYKLSPA